MKASFITREPGASLQEDGGVCSEWSFYLGLAVTFPLKSSPNQLSEGPSNCLNAGFEWIWALTLQTSYTWSAHQTLITCSPPALKSTTLIKNTIHRAHADLITEVISTVLCGRYKKLSPPRCHFHSCHEIYHKVQKHKTCIEEMTTC